MKKESRKQYHPPMCASLELEFRENRDEIICETEHNLNTKPNSIDFLVVKKDVKNMIEDIHSLDNERELLNAESVFDLMTRLNRNKDWMKEVNGMGAFRDLFKEDFEQRDRKIAELSEQLQSKDEQLQSKDEQLQNEKEKNTKLQQEIEQLKNQMKEQMNKIAML